MSARGFTQIALNKVRGMGSGGAMGFDGVHRLEVRCFDGLWLLGVFWVLLLVFFCSKKGNPFYEFLGGLYRQILLCDG